ncbi:MAG: anthranilate synthase component I [Alphaproteobacteria bacterium]
MKEQSFEQFKQGWQQGKAQLVWQEFNADLETPVSCYMKLAATEPYAFLLESVEGGEIRGRYSFIGIKPDLLWRSNQNEAMLAKLGQACDADNAPEWQLETRPTLESLRALCEESRLDLPDHLPPMSAGLIGYLGYDTIRLIENIPANNPDPLALPEGLFMRPSIMVIFDTITNILSLATPVWQNDHNQHETPQALWQAALERLAIAKDRLAQPLPLENIARSTQKAVIESLMDGETYQTMVQDAKELIKAGDIFQVVLSQRYRALYQGSPFNFYRALRRTNPAPFLFFLKFDDFAVTGSSPEILVRNRDHKVTIRPLAGTRPRGKDQAQDIANEQALLKDPKELAEHLMLLDLGRNDVGRVSKLGSVKVTDQFMVERYSHVMHIVSNVEGELAAEEDSLTALFAGFPAGTVSGAPKVRAMEIIDQLEPLKRGIYAGCVGYFAADGSMDSCIALRTAIIKDDYIYMQAGAGIVADSDPASEQQECQAKVGALITALHLAQEINSNN